VVRLFIAVSSLARQYLLRRRASELHDGHAIPPR
jgi:hypothetical protein